MSFYKKLRDESDTDFDEDAFLEEQYQKMFKKIARDFVHIDDLREILNSAFDELFSEQSYMNRNAYLRAKEYQRNLDAKLSDRKTYQDIDELVILVESKK